MKTVLLYIELVILETFIILEYAWFPTVLTLLLASVGWNYTIVLSFIKLFSFIQMIHNEDQRTGTLHFRFLLIKIAIAVSLYVLAQVSVSAIQDNLPENLSHYVGGTKIKVSRERAKSIFMTQNSKDLSSKIKYFLLRMLVEYLLMCYYAAQFRATFLFLVFAVYGTFRLIVWYYLPDRRNPDDSSQSSSDSDDNNNTSAHIPPRS